MIVQSPVAIFSFYYVKSWNVLDYMGFLVPTFVTDVTRFKWVYLSSVIWVVTFRYCIFISALYIGLTLFSYVLDLIFVGIRC